MYKIFTILNKKEEKFLRTPTKEVANIFDEKIQKLIKEMGVIMKKEGGVGLAANQIGENLQLALIEYQNKNLVLINPKLIKYSKKISLGEEGCLSVPKCVGIVPRYEKIVVEALDQNGKKIKVKAKNMLARIIQHEMDHLNGVLFIDKAEKIYYLKNNGKS